MAQVIVTDPEEEPDPPRHKRRHEDQANIVVRYWLPLLLVMISLFGSGRDGFGWILGRESKEREMAAEIVRMRSDMTAQAAQVRSDIEELRKTFVRQDVYSTTLGYIEQRLAAIDRKLPERR